MTGEVHEAPHGFLGAYMPTVASLGHVDDVTAARAQVDALRAMVAAWDRSFA